ncbi:MAG: phosphoribosylformylglycinamidine cyclo-ligase [Planctomycetota bacterium]|nr:phosphoribosylformylglycinamidine cyclo-ligase [Planctomycetota bacterium]
MSEPITYRDAGVNIDAQAEALAKAKSSIRSTFIPGVLSDVGHFGGLFDLDAAGVGGQVLVASADGVGTKLEVAKRAGIFDTVGRDLVQHCINDVLVQGARPLFFLDYVGTGKLDPDVVSGLISGCAAACKEHGLALLGGETAEMPGLYAEGDFDLVGFLVGSVARDKILDGSAVKPGQALLGLGSSGLHTNGYSLARKVLFERLGLELDDRPEALGGVTVAEALLAPHRSYFELLWPLLEERKLAAMAHITGGGLLDNLPRVLGGCDAVIEPGSWPVPGLFQMLVEGAGIDRDEAHRAFNMGIGMVLLVDEAEREAVTASLEARGEAVHRIGHTEAGEGLVRWAR